MGAQGSSIYFFRILRIELAQALRNLVTRQQLPATTRDHFLLDRWEDDLFVLERWFFDGLRRFRLFLSQFDEAVEVGYRLPIWERSVRIMARYQLRSLNALHVATAREIGILDFATPTIASDASMTRGCG